MILQTYRLILREFEERDDALAVSFWDSLNDIGYKRDPRMFRYVKTL